MNPQTDPPITTGAFWLMLRRIAVWAACVDVIYLVVFLAMDMPVVAWLNVLSACAYAAAYLLLRRRINLPAVLLMWAEVLIHAGACTLLLGWETGVHYFMLVFIPAVAVSRTRKQAFTALGFILAVYLGLDLATKMVEPRYVLPPDTVFRLRWLSITVVFVMFAFIGREYVQRIQRAEGRLRHMAIMLERERIARELHDTLLQGFHGLALRFQAAADRIPEHEPARAMMEAALQRADDVLVEGRERVTALRMPLGEATRLADAINDMGEEYCAVHRVEFQFRQQGEERALVDDVCDVVYRVAREALANACEHARARCIVAELLYNTENLQLKVRDDGIGVPPETLALGGGDHCWGIVGMRERARRIGARLAIRSSPGAGTEVRLTVPADLAFRSARDG